MLHKLNLIKAKLKSKNEKFESLYRRMSNIHFTLRRMQLEEKILHSTESGITNKRYCDCNIIVSLTSYGKRLYDVCFTIESLMQQTYKPNQIVLWLDPSCFTKALPEALVKQQERGLQIFKVEDIRSYKKIIPSLKEYPNDVLITVDDDLIYEFDFLERLIKSYLSSPDEIHVCRTHVIDFNIDGSLKSYDDWEFESSKTNNKRLLFFTSGGGYYSLHIA